MTAFKEKASLKTNWGNSKTIVSWLEQYLINIVQKSDIVTISLGNEVFADELQSGLGAVVLAETIEEVYGANSVNRIEIEIRENSTMRERLRKHKFVREIIKKFSATIVSVQEGKLWQNEVLEEEDKAD